jgi:hypothetical protein
MRRNSAVLGLVGVLLVAAPTAADWLVTRAGGRVETKGSWQIKGKLVIFTQTDGSLSSLRLSEVDLEASRKVTQEAKAEAAAPPAPQPAKKKIAVLTDKDFPKPEGSSPAKPEGDAEKEDDQPASSSATVTVSSWQRLERSTGDGIEIQGTLQNNTNKIASAVAVEVQLYNEAGERVATAPGILSTPSIQPRGTVEFRASFRGVFTFAEAKFETRGWPLDLAPAPDQQPAEDNPPH